MNIRARSLDVSRTSNDVSLDGLDDSRSSDEILMTCPTALFCEVHCTVGVTYKFVRSTVIIRIAQDYSYADAGKILLLGVHRQAERYRESKLLRVSESNL